MGCGSSKLAEQPAAPAAKQQDAPVPQPIPLLAPIGGGSSAPFSPGPAKNGSLPPLTSHPQSTSTSSVDGGSSAGDERPTLTRISTLTSTVDAGDERDSIILSAAYGALSPMRGTDTEKEQVAKLHTAMRWQREEDVRRLLKTHGNLLDIPDPQNGNTAIHIAAQNGHVPLVKFICANDCNLDARNSGGNTALHMAISYDLDDVGAILIKQGADPTVINNDGFMAKWGLMGEKSEESPLYKLEQFKAADTTHAFLETLEVLKTAKGLEVSLMARAALLKKKEFKEKWTPECQRKLGRVLASI